MRQYLFVLRLISLSVAFIAVIFAMKTLKQSGLGTSTKNVLGMGDELLSWCDTRVKSLKTRNGHVISQRGLKWYREAPVEKELDSLAVEKWFGSNCKLPITATVDAGAGSANLPPLLSVDFVRGASEHFRSSNGTIVWKGKTFASPELESAIQQLEQLPEARKHQ